MEMEPRSKNYEVGSDEEDDGGRIEHKGAARDFSEFGSLDVGPRADRARRLMVICGIVTLALILVVVLSVTLSSMSSRNSSKPSGDPSEGGVNDSPDSPTSTPAPTTPTVAPQKPASMCEGGSDGTLKRLSKAAFEYWTAINPTPTKSVILMLGDGYGPHIHTLARSVKRSNTQSSTLKMALDPYLIGSAITSALGNIITDSAAGATAYSSGHKTFNGALNVIPAESSLIRSCADSLGNCQIKQVANMFEGCRARGMATGIVVTTVLPHATPAAWSAHASYRGYYDFIAQQQLELDPPLDVFMGGGRRYYDSRREDGRDLLEEHKDKFTIIGSRDELNQQKSFWESNPPSRLKPLVGLFADDNMMYEVDRKEAPQSTRQPSIQEMTTAAVSRLQATGRKFCLVVEGSRIDHALHADDAGAAAYDAIAFDEAFGEVIELVKNDESVQVFSVADHSTGGLTVGAQRDWELWYSQDICHQNQSCDAGIGTYPYGTTDGWHPEVIAAARSSIANMAAKMCCDPEMRASSNRRVAYVKQTLDIDATFEEEAAFTAAVARLHDDFECSDDIHHFTHGKEVGRACTMPTEYTLSRMQEYAARVKFTTMGHTSVDIHVYAHGTERLKVAGTMENNEVGQKVIEEVMGMDLSPITQALQECDIPAKPET